MTTNMKKFSLTLAVLITLALILSPAVKAVGIESINYFKEVEGDQSAPIPLSEVERIEKTVDQLALKNQALFRMKLSNLIRFFIKDEDVIQNVHETIDSNIKIDEIYPVGMLFLGGLLKLPKHDLVMYCKAVAQGKAFRISLEEAYLAFQPEHYKGSEIVLPSKLRPQPQR